MSSDVTIKFNKNTIQKLYEANDKVVYAIARQTLDRVGEAEATAYKTGATQRSMFARGVQADSEGYYIGDFTSYAIYVYKLKKANWTNPRTRPQWFHTIWQEQGDLITENCIRRYL